MKVVYVANLADPAHKRSLGDVNAHIYVKSTPLLFCATEQPITIIYVPPPLVLRIKLIDD